MESEERDRTRKVTSCWLRFFAEHERLLEFVAYVTKLATGADQVQRIAVKALYETQEPVRFTREIQRLEESSPLRELQRKHRTLILEMMTSRAVENFLTYLTELLVLIFKSCPEALRSSETISLEEVFRYSSLTELTHAVAEKRVNQLSYKGMRDLAKYTTDRLGLVMTENAEELDRLVEIIEVRNIIVHNRGTVNQVFINKTKLSSTTTGQVLNFNIDQAMDDINFLACAVSNIDSRSIEKFQLESSEAFDPALGSPAIGRARAAAANS